MKEIASAISEGARAFLMARVQDSRTFCTHFICADRPGNRQLDHGSMLCLRSFDFPPLPGTAECRWLHGLMSERQMLQETAG